MELNRSSQYKQQTYLASYVLSGLVVEGDGEFTPTASGCSWSEPELSPGDFCSPDPGSL